MCPSGQELARSTAHTNQTTFHQHRHTSHRSARTQHTPSVTAPPMSDQLSLHWAVFFQNQQHILKTHFLYHFAVFCLYCTIISTFIAFTAQSLQSVLPLLYYHFAVSCLYSTITSPCTASTVQSLQRVLPQLHNHFDVYCLCCTITSPCSPPTVQSLHVLPRPYNHFAVYRIYCIITSQGKTICYKNRSTNGLQPRRTRPKPTEQYPAARDAEVLRSLRSALWPGFFTDHSSSFSLCSNFVSICKSWVIR
jgi:hypothetical protein